MFRRVTHPWSWWPSLCTFQTRSPRVLFADTSDGRPWTGGHTSEWRQTCLSKIKNIIFLTAEKKLFFKKRKYTLDVCILCEKNFSTDVFWDKKIIFFQMDGHLCYRIKLLKYNFRLKSELHIYVKVNILLRYYCQNYFIFSSYSVVDSSKTPGLPDLFWGQEPFLISKRQLPCFQNQKESKKSCFFNCLKNCHYQKSSVVSKVKNFHKPN